MTPTITASPTTVAVGQTLTVSAGLTGPGGLSGRADVYAGLVAPDNTVEFVTSTGVVNGTLGNLASFRPLATSVSLATPFSVTVPTFHSHPRTASDPHGTWLFVVVVVNSGALTAATIPEASIIGLASAEISFP